MDREEEDDYVVRELDVVAVNKLDLFLLQFPLKPCYGTAPEIHNAKFKPEHRKLDVTGDETMPHGESTLIQQSSNLSVGVVKDNVMHLTRLKDVLQIRPHFGNLTSQDESVEQMVSDDEEEEAKVEEVKETKPALEQVQMKRKESDRSQTVRLQSFSYMKSQEDAEPWHRLKVHGMASNESAECFDGLYGSASVI